MKLKINDKPVGHLMTDLNISSDRCQELCGIIEETIMRFHNQGIDKVSLAAVVQKALESAKDDNEVVFVSITAGEYFNEYENSRRRQGAGEDILGELFRSLRSRSFTAAN